MSMPDLSAVGRPSTSTELAWARTNLAYERTLMAWVRTATSLITFGFAVYKFFQFEAGRSAAPRAPRARSGASHWRRALWGHPWRRRHARRRGRAMRRRRHPGLGLRTDLRRWP